MLKSPSLEPSHSTSEIATVSARIALPAPPASKPKRRWASAVGVAALLVALGGAGWHFTAALRGPRPEDNLPLAAKTGPRNLDELPANVFTPLLDRVVLPLGHPAESLNLWRFDPVRENLDIKGPGLFVFPLGTTTRARFTLEAGVAQSPWTGNVGIFFGYQENLKAKADKVPEQPFATFQVVYLHHRTEDPAEDVLSVLRSRVTLWHGSRGEIQLTLENKAKHDLPLFAAGQRVLAIDVQHNRLSCASFGPIELGNLFSLKTNAKFENDSFVGGVGVVSFGNSCGFSNVRFLAQGAN